MKKLKTIPTSPLTSPKNLDPPTQWSWHHQTLLQIRSRLMRKRYERETAIRAVLERGGTDSGDVAIEERENTDMLTKLTFSEAELTEVDAALERIRQNTYGICEATGQLINPERLQAIPWARFSFQVATRREENVVREAPTM